MKKLIDLIQEELVKAFTAAEMDPSYARVSVSNRPDLCEYQCNGAMAAAKAYHKAPIQLAEAVVEKVTDHSVIGEIEAVKPGFINLKINPEFLADYLSKMQNDEDLSVEKAKNPKTIIVDYGGANVAKPLHVGHLRSAIIGESIKRMGRFMGHNMIGDVHLGDWVVQMGLIHHRAAGAPSGACFYLMSPLRESTRRKHRLRSASSRRFILAQAANRKRTRTIRNVHSRQRESCSRAEEDIVRSGNTL